MTNITVLPSVNSQEELDKLQEETKKKNKGKRRKQSSYRQDDICEHCHNADTCNQLCPPLLWINGRSPQTEIPESELPNPYRIEYKDYKASLNELLDDKREDDSVNIEFIREIPNKPPDIHFKAILALKHANIPIVKIAKLLHISRAKLYRTIVLFVRQSKD